METIINETLHSLATALNIDMEKLGEPMQVLARQDHRYVKDLKINLLNSLAYPNLTKKESYLLALSAAINDKNPYFTGVFTVIAQNEGASDTEIAETYACVSLMNTNNVFYRFRHFTNKEFYNTTPAGIKMSVMMNPALGKEFFELMSLAISALNGCEMCVNAHEESVIKLGATQQRVYDAIRLIAVARGFLVLN